MAVAAQHSDPRYCAWTQARAMTFHTSCRHWSRHHSMLFFMRKRYTPTARICMGLFFRILHQGVEKNLAPGGSQRARSFASPGSLMDRRRQTSPPRPFRVWRVAWPFTGLATCPPRCGP